MSAAAVARAFLAALLASLVCAAAPAAAAPPRPLDLRVAGGEEAWHPDNVFQLDWTTPPSATPIAAVRYRLRDPLGASVREAVLFAGAESIGDLGVPDLPGVYTVEVWLEDVAGAQGPAATALLRFDDTPPAAIDPPAVPSWIGRTAFPVRLRLGHPAGPAPPAGIRGYAIAIDAVLGGEPCAAPDRCTETETSLRGGTEEDTIAIAVLPEGTSYLHAVAVSGSGIRSRHSAQAVLRVDTTDPTTRLAGVPAGWTRHPVRLRASASDAGSGMSPSGQGPPPFTAIRVDGGAPTVAAGAAVEETLIEEGAHRIAYYARDAAGNVDDGASSNGIANRQPRSAVVRIDRHPPSVAFVNAQDPQDPELLRVRVADSLSGADLGRGWIGVRRVGSGDPFARLPAAPPASGELRARWDSDSHPAGPYEFTATGFDRAGGSATTRRRLDGTPMVLSSPLKAPTALALRFAHGPPGERTVHGGRGARVGGRLTGADAGLAGMPVQVVERFAAGADPATRTTTVWTDPDGAFALRLGAGPSREVSASFAGRPALARSASPTLRLRVRAAVSLRTSARAAAVGGAALVFRGRVGAPPGQIPSGGKSVQLQFRLPGLGWTEFRTVQTDGRGRFRYAYRFSDDDSRGVRFLFRAHAPAQDGWPYESGSSRPVVVRGR
jgi:hypothetical protein